MPPEMPYTSGQYGGGGGGGKGRVLRPLGTIRHSSLPDTVVKFPPLHQSADYTSDSIQGIHGSAMALPPTKIVLTERPSPDHNNQIVTHHSPVRCGSTSHSEAHSSRSEADDKARIELKEAVVREKHLKQQLMLLQKVIDDLKAQLRERDQTIASLQLQFQRQEEHYKELYEREQRIHAETRQELRTAESEATELRDKLDLVKREHRQEIDQLKLTLEQKLSEVVTLKDREISSRDEKLSRLKHQMADALKGNSWERQQQLDELTKELGRVQEESDMLRLKMKALQGRSNNKGVASGCSNCATMNTRLTQQQSAVSERDKMIVELKTACAQCEKQIAQQSEMLKQYSQSKGIRPKGPHK